MVLPLEGMGAALSDVFGEPLTLTRDGAAPVTVDGHIVEKSVDADGMEGLGVRDVSLTLYVRADFTQPLKEGDLVQRGSTTWRVRDPHPDAGTDSTRLLKYDLEVTDD